MDSRVMELRTRQWISVFKEQAESGLSKDEWCIINGINRTSFFRWQKRVRSYLLEHDGNTNQLYTAGVNDQINNACFIELPCSQAAAPGVAALRNLHDDNWEEEPPISIHYHDFSIDVAGIADEKQLTTVLRALKNVD